MLLRGGSGFLIFVVRDAEGMVEGTCFGRVGADHPWPPAQSQRSGRRQANRRCPGSASSQPFPGDTHSRRDSGSETVAFCSAAPVAPPEAAAAEASLEVERLQGVIVALGEGNPLSAPLQEALRSARAKSKILPVNERVEACKGFLERGKKRLVRTEAVIAKAHEQKLIFEAELREGEARLLQLQAEFEAQPEGPSVTELQSRIDLLIRERDALQKIPPKRALPGLWMTDGTPPIVQEVPPMPEDRQDLEGWLSCRNCELRNALEFGDGSTVGKVGALVAQGSARMVAFAQDIPMNGQAKSSLMSVLIDQADAKRRCIEATQTDGSQV